MPSCIPRPSQSGVTQGTTTLSPGLNLVTRFPTSTISPTASWPSILSVLGPEPPCNACVSDEQGATTIGRTIAC